MNYIRTVHALIQYVVRVNQSKNHVVKDVPTKL